MDLKRILPALGVLAILGGRWLVHHHSPNIADLNEEQFAEEMTRRLRAEGYEVRFNGQNYTLDIKRGDETTLFYLQNAFDEYRSAPADQRADVFTRYLKPTHALKERNDTLEAARAHLLPVIREGFYFEVLRLEEEAAKKVQGKGIAHRPITDVLHWAIARDSDGQLAFVMEHQLERWKTALDPLLPIALENLRKRSSEKFHTPHPGVHVSPWRDSYDTSRMLLPDLIRSLPVKGDHIALAPNRDTLLITGSQDAEGLLAVADLVDAALAEPRAMSALAYRLDKDRWVRFLPSVTPAVYRRYKTLEVDTLGKLYDEQRKVLDKRNERLHQEIFVATLNTSTVEKTDLPVSIATWTRGAPSWLPRTDFIAFVDLARSEDHQYLGLTRWEVMEKVAPDLLRPTGFSPERYEVTGFPSPQQLKALHLRPDPD